MGTEHKNEGLFKSVVAVHFILLLHVLLVAGLGLLVLFFRGVVNYMAWIFLGGCLAIAASGYYIYRRMKSEGISLREFLQTPLVAGKTVEVSLLGGFASFRIDGKNSLPSLDGNRPESHCRLEDSAAVQTRELAELSRLLERELITPEEYATLKERLIAPGAQARTALSGKGRAGLKP